MDCLIESLYIFFKAFSSLLMDSEEMGNILLPNLATQEISDKMLTQVAEVVDGSW